MGGVVIMTCPHIFLQEAFNDYLLAHFQAHQIIVSRRVLHYPEIVEHLDHLDMLRSASYLDCSTETMYRLIDAGDLTPLSFPDNQRGVWFVRQQLQQLKRSWGGRLQIGQLRRLLGLSLEPVHHLISSGLLPTVSSDACLRSQQTYVERQSITDFLDSLRLHTLIAAKPVQDFVLLSDICIHTCFPDLTIASIFKRVLADKLTAHHPSTTLLPLSDFWFTRPEIAQLDTTLRQELRICNRRELKTRLQINWPTFYHLLETRFILPTVPLGKRLFFREDDVLAFQRQWILLNEAATLLHIHVVSLYSLVVRHNLFEPAFDPRQEQRGCLIFERAVVLAWHKQFFFLAELRDLGHDVDHFLQHISACFVDPKLSKLGVYPRTQLADYLAQLEEAS